MRNALFNIVGILLFSLLLLSCTEENRQFLENRNIRLSFELSIHDTISPHYPYLCNLSERLKIKSSDTTDIQSVRFFADVEVSLFNDPQKIKTYTVAIHPLHNDKWQTDTINIINPGVCHHSVRKITVYASLDTQTPLFSSVDIQSIHSFNCPEDELTPVLISNPYITDMRDNISIPVSLFSTWQQRPDIFGYSCWLKKETRYNAFSFLICDSQVELARQKLNKLLRGKMVLSRKDNRSAGSPFKTIEERIFFQEIKTTIILNEEVTDHDIYLLEFFFPDRTNPELIISDTLSWKQLYDVRQSGFWIPDPEDSDEGMLQFDLNQLQGRKSGSLCSTDTIPSSEQWSPSFRTTPIQNRGHLK